MVKTKYINKLNKKIQGNANKNSLEKNNNVEIKDKFNVTQVEQLINLVKKQFFFPKSQSRKGILIFSFLFKNKLIYSVGAEVLNQMSKKITIKEIAWNNSIVIAGNAAMAAGPPEP